MCLIAWSWLSHPRWQLVIAGNRDEFHGRGTASAHWWRDHRHIYGGRDLEAGGSWFAMSRDGRLAAVTNVREPGAPKMARSRGELVAGFLSSADAIDRWAAGIDGEGNRWSGFNLIVFDLRGASRQSQGDGPSALFMSNRRVKGAIPLQPGLHALSNGTLNEPWPKVKRLRERLDAALAEPHPEAALFRALADPEPAIDAELPDTGLDREHERRLSAVRIMGPDYGTRSSSVVLVDHDGKVEFAERTWSPAHESPVRESRSRFVLGGRSSQE
jgi:uncharacterized protein with NRDE domain